MLPAHTAIAEVRKPLHGLPVFITGSAVAAAKYHNVSDTAYSDVDVFCATTNALVTAVNRMQNAGFVFKDRFVRVWHRWMKYGFNQWHTNSLEMEHPSSGIKLNLIYKLVDGHATTSLAQVIESFDFGLLAIGGWDMQRDTYHDMRSYLFPDRIIQQDVPLPMLSPRREDWREGFFSRYQGLREFGRYVKYHDYGYDMSLVKDDLLTGYWAGADYMSDRDDPEKKQLGEIYEKIALDISNARLDQLREASKTILYEDSLDAIMNSLS